MPRVLHRRHLDVVRQADVHVVDVDDVAMRRRRLQVHLQLGLRHDPADHAGASPAGSSSFVSPKTLPFKPIIEAQFKTFNPFFFSDYADT